MGNDLVFFTYRVDVKRVSAAVFLTPTGYRKTERKIDNINLNYCYHLYGFSYLSWRILLLM